jgi:hypothetical protein
MTPFEIIRQAEKAGIRLYARAGAIRYRGSRSALDGLLEHIRGNKAGLLAILEPKSNPAEFGADNGPTFPRWRVTLADGRTLELGSPSGLSEAEARYHAEQNGAVASLEPAETPLVPAIEARARNTDFPPVRCADCRHQEPTAHPALIRCGAGRQAPGACGMWWGADLHDCERFIKREIQR